MSVRLEVFPAEAWADRVGAMLAARLRAEPALRLCLPAGDTPAPVYAALVAAAAHGEAPLGAATVIQLDEYVGLPPDSPARCGVQLRRELLDRLPTPPTFHAFDVDGPDPVVAARSQDRIAAEGLDLTLLGLGMNGHVGLNEPGSRPDGPTGLVRVAASSRSTAVERYGAESPPTAGVTLGLARLLASREIWLLVTGERKAAILARALLEPEGPDCPATYLRRHPRLLVLADEPAAAELRTRGRVGASRPIPLDRPS